MWKQVKIPYVPTIFGKRKLLTECGKILGIKISTENQHGNPENVDYFLALIFAVMSFTVWANWGSFFILSSIFLMEEMTVV